MVQVLPAAVNQDVEYEDFYESNLSLPLGAADTDLHLTVLPTSAVGFLVVNPAGATPEIIYYNEKGADYVRCPSAVDGSGRGVFQTAPGDYEQGTVVGMYSVAAFFEGIVTGKTMRNGFIQARHFATDINPNEWIGTGATLVFGANLGNRVSTYIVSGDHTATLSVGRKLQMPRVAVTNTHCGSFVVASSQYASVGSPAGITFTDDFTCEAWIKLNSYQQGVISSRYNGTSGFVFEIQADGTVVLEGFNGGSGNNRYIVSLQSIPLHKKVHVAAKLDMSGFTTATCSVYIEGLPVFVGLVSTGTNPTALVQAGNLQIGAANSVGFIDGEVSESRIWSTLRTDQQILDNMNKRLVGTETGLVAYHQLDNDFTDKSVNNNTLLPQNGAVVNTLDSPFSATEHGVIINSVFSSGNTTLHVYTGNERCAPTEDLPNTAYSSGRAPAGFPADENSWTITQLQKVQRAQASATINQWYNLGSAKLDVPIGRWIIGYEVNLQINTGAVASMWSTLSNGNNTESDLELSGRMYDAGTSTMVSYISRQKRSSILNTVLTPFYLNAKTDSATSTLAFNNDSTGGTQVIYARCPYL